MFNKSLSYLNLGFENVTKSENVSFFPQLHYDYLCFVNFYINIVRLFPAVVCKKTWANLRDSFRRALKRRRETKSGQTVSKIRKWKFEDEMSFLLPFMQERDTCGNLKDVSDDDNENERNEDNINEYDDKNDDREDDRNNDRRDDRNNDREDDRNDDKDDDKDDDVDEESR